jgi:hypothetical protein
MNSTQRHLIHGNPYRATTKENQEKNENFSPARTRVLVFLTQHIVMLSVIPIARRLFLFFVIISALSRRRHRRPKIQKWVAQEDASEKALSAAWGCFIMRPNG